MKKTRRESDVVGVKGLGGQQREEEYPGQGAERSQIMQAGAILEPGGSPLGGIKRLVLNEEAVFVEAECLFKLDQNLFSQPMPMLLLEDQAAKQAAPDDTAHCEKQDFDGRKTAFEGTQQKSKRHRDQAERAKRGQAHHLLATLIHFSLVEGIENCERLLNAFCDHGRIASFAPVKFQLVVR